MKKIVSALLAIVMSLGLCTSTLALNSEMQEVLEERVETEIVREKEAIFDLVYAQLEAQDAESMMPIYEAVLGPQIEANVRQKYGMLVERETQYIFEEGGILKYETLGAYVLQTYMIPKDFEDYLVGQLNPLGEACMAGVWKGISVAAGLAEGYLSQLVEKWSGICTVLSLVNAVLDYWAIEEVRDNGGYGVLVAIQSGADKSCILIPWENPFRAVVPPAATNLKTVNFKYDCNRDIV